MGEMRVHRQHSASARRGLVAIVMTMFALAAGAAPSARDIIDRVLAVVDGALITQSDVNAAVRLGLIPTASAADPVAAVLDALIERRLILAEVDRYAPPDPAEPDVDRLFERVRARVGEGPFADVLLQTGGSPEQVRRFVRDDLRIDAYLQQRFGAMQPSELDVAQHYREHPERFQGRSLEDAHDQIVAQLITERRSAVVGDWVAGLRRRANINVLPR